MGQGQVPGGGTAGQMRQISAITETVVAVDDNETTLAAANPLRRNLIIQNNGPDPVQIYVTTALGFGGGGVQLAPGSASTVGGVWEAFQEGVGVVQLEIFGVCDTGNTASVSVTEEE